MINLIRQEIIIYLTGLKFEIMKENSKNALKFYPKIHKTERSEVWKYFHI